MWIQAVELFAGNIKKRMHSGMENFDFTNKIGHYRFIDLESNHEFGGIRLLSRERLRRNSIEMDE